MQSPSSSAGSQPASPPADPAEARIHALEAELRELQHRAKNSLQLVISLLKLQAGRIRDPDARAAYEHTLLRIEALAILYRLLHESGSGTHVRLESYLKTLCDTVRQGVTGRGAGIPVSVSAGNLDIGLYEAMPLGLIVAELLTNSLNHAYPDEPWIRLTVVPAEGPRARLTIEDNGRPLPEGFDTNADDGLMLAEALAVQLGDGLVTDSGPRGTHASLTFPI